MDNMELDKIDVTIEKLDINISPIDINPADMVMDINPASLELELDDFNGFPDIEFLPIKVTLTDVELDKIPDDTGGNGG